MAGEADLEAIPIGTLREHVLPCFRYQRRQDCLNRQDPWLSPALPERQWLTQDARQETVRHYREAIDAMTARQLAQTGKRDEHGNPRSSGSGTNYQALSGL